MVKAWRRFWDGSGRLWRAEGRAPDRGVAPPKLTIPRTAPGAGPGGQRILFINQYYWPDHASTAQHLTDLAEALAEEGYECHVVCSRGGYRPGAQRLPAFEERRGVQIHRVGATALGRRNTWTRMTDYLSFYARAALRSLTLPRFDVVATLTTPPIIGLIGTILRRLKGSIHVYWSMDLHPDASLALGRMSAGNPVVAALARLSDWVYRRADKVVVLGPYMADRVGTKQVRADRLITIPVWSRRDEVYPLPPAGHPLRVQLGLVGKFIAMYSGNHGLAHRFDEFIEAARRLRDRDDLMFLYVGEGPRLAEVRQAQEREGLTNIQILNYFPRELLHASLSLADVHLISMRPEMTGVVVPGKLYGAMASGRPTLFLGPDHCESADTIRRAGCGFTVRPGDAGGVVSALERLAAEPELARQLGARGREAFLTEHDRDVCCARWSRMLSDLLGIRGAPARRTFPALAGLSPQGAAGS